MEGMRKRLKSDGDNRLLFLLAKFYLSNTCLFGTNTRRENPSLEGNPRTNKALLVKLGSSCVKLNFGFLGMSYYESFYI